MKKIYITKEDKNILESVLMGDFDVYVFGSRITGKHQPFSDIDICLKSSTKIDRAILAELRFKLADSNLPYKVDLIDYHSLDADFQTLINSQAVKLTETEAIL